MKIIPKYDIGSAIQFYVPGQIKRGILTSYPKGNNIYYNQDWNGYNDWHSKNIVLKGYNTIQNPESRDWEDYLKKGMDSWNDAGGFDWLYSDNPSYRQHRLQSAGTKTHQDLIMKDYDWLNTVIGDEDNYSKYNIPSNSFTADRFENGKLVGRNGTRSDNDFGVQTGNRRPTIHVRTGLAATREWDDYFKKLGYVGAYEYLDHWIPTKDSNKATRKFGSVVEQYELKDLEKVQDPEKEKEGSLTPEERADPESLWSKLGAGLKNVAPDLLDTLRLAGNMINNQRVYNESMKAIKPNLQQSYHTYRQVVGDEATKQAYYRRAVQGEQKAAQPFTADADKQVAYMNEAKRIGDESRAQGDLADNQRIRETSAESVAHLDSNRERDTAVANSNITEMNKADAAKHQLTAQKYSADWTNLEQYLMGRQYKLEKNKAEQKELADKIWLLTEQNKLENDPTFISLQKAVDEAWTKASKDGKVSPENDEDVKKAIQNLRNWKTKQEIIMLQSRPTYTYSAKQGTKLEKKTKDESLKYLYKTSKDIVEHFRKMSKMTDDSRIKTLPKAIKLPTHPRKMQLGGVAPFTIYRPLGLGGESAVSSQTTSSGSGKSEKDEAGKNKLDMVKELFKAIQGQGLPIDVSLAYREISNTLNKAKALGKEMTTDDIASMYLKSMDTISRLKHSKEVYDKAQAVATQRESLDEFAVDASGNYVVQDEDNNITTVKSLEEIKEQGLNPITNQQLLNLRAYSPNLALQQGDYFINNIINNGMGINKIGAQIKALAGTIGSSDTKIEGLSEIESGRVKAGLQILARTDGTPNGHYSVTTLTKDQENQVQYALKYIENMLTPSQKAILDIHGGTKQNIALFLSSQQDYVKEQTLSPLTGKASKDANGTTGGKGGTENSAGLAFVLGQGPREVVDFNTGTSNAIRVLGIKGTLQTHSNENLGQGSTLQDATKSQQGGYFEWNKATFGGSRLNSGAYSHIILNSSEVLGMDLPYTKDINGNEIPDFQMLKKTEQADQEIARNNIENPQEINKIYQKYGLPAKYDKEGNLNKLNYKRFAAIQATLDENSLQNKEAILSDEVSLAGEVERDLYVEAMKKQNKDYDLSNGMWITGWGKDELYKGTIFVPYSEDVAFAAISSGEPFKQSLPDNAASVYQMQYTQKASTYKAPTETLYQVKNN